MLENSQEEMLHSSKETSNSKQLQDWPTSYSFAEWLLITIVMKETETIHV